MAHINEYFLNCKTEIKQFAFRYFQWMLVTNYSEFTVETRSCDLKFFFVWCEDRGIERPSEITARMLDRFRHYAYNYRKKDGARLDPKTQGHYLLAVRGFFKWLARNNYILFNPAADLDMPRRGIQIPQRVLSLSDIAKVFDLIKVSRPLGIRDRAILETLFSTGVRRRELCNLKIDDVNFMAKTVMIRQGKWKKDRLIPIGQSALFWIGKYLNEVRDDYVIEPDELYLFLSRDGKQFNYDYLSQMVSDYLQKAGVGKKGFSCHSLRHSMATEMLNQDVDIRLIQEMLGHESIASTQIYTKLSIKKLKEAHAKTLMARGLDDYISEAEDPENILVSNPLAANQKK